MKKYIYILLVPFLLLNCDYKPIYSKKNNTNFSIEKIGIKGDKEINNLVNKKLKKYQNNNNENKFFIEITSSYTKNSQSKNLSGKTTNYLITVQINFDITKVNETKSMIIKEDFLIKNFSDKFEENKLENIKKENLVNLIINRFLIQLSRM